MPDNSVPELPVHISVEQQKKRARELRAAHRQHQSEAACRLRQHLSEFAGCGDEAIFDSPLTLNLCQLVLAREHGFTSWSAFKRAIESQNCSEDIVQRLCDAIDRDDGAAALKLLGQNPHLLTRPVFEGPEGYFANYKPLPFVYALQCGRVATVQAIISAYPQLVKTHDEDGNEPVDSIFLPYGGWFPGVHERRHELYRYLKAHGASPTIDTAVMAQDIDLALAMLRKDPSLADYGRRENGGTSDWKLLVRAANSSCVPVVEAVLALQTPEPQQLKDAVTRAAFGGSLEVLELLLPHASQEVKNYALFTCCESLALKSARKLLHHGADANAEVLSGDKLWTPLYMALATYSRKPWRGEFIDLLIMAGARRLTPMVNTSSFVQGGPVLAFFRSRLDLLENHYANDSAITRQRFSFSDDELAVTTPINGATLLHLAMEFIDLPVAQWLVDHGADVNARSERQGEGEGHTPLFQAARAYTMLYNNAGGAEKQEDLVAWLLKRGAAPNLRATICNSSSVAGEKQKNKNLRDVTVLGYLRAMADRKEKRNFERNPVVQVLREAGGIE